MKKVLMFIPLLAMLAACGSKGPTEAELKQQQQLDSTVVEVEKAVEAGEETHESLKNEIDGILNEI